jgi:hypothetical protein
MYDLTPRSRADVFLNLDVFSMTLSVPKVIFVISSRSLFDRHRNTCHAKNFLGPRTIFSATGREAFERSSDIWPGGARCWKISIR